MSLYSRLKKFLQVSTLSVLSTFSLQSESFSQDKDYPTYKRDSDLIEEIDSYDNVDSRCLVFRASLEEILENGEFVDEETDISLDFPVSAVSFYDDTLYMTRNFDDGSSMIIAGEEYFFWDRRIDSLDIEEDGSFSLTSGEDLFEDRLRNPKDLFYSFTGIRFNHPLPNIADAMCSFSEGKIIAEDKRLILKEIGRGWRVIDIDFSIDSMLEHEGYLYFTKKDENIKGVMPEPYIADYSDTAVIFNSSISCSDEVARYYQKQRGIDENNMLDISGFTGDYTQRGITLEQFNEFYPQIQSELDRKGLRDNTKYLMLIGVPEIILPREPYWSSEDEWRENYRWSVNASIDDKLLFIKLDDDERIRDIFLQDNPYYQQEDLDVETMDLYITCRIPFFTVKDAKNKIDSYSKEIDCKNSYFLLDWTGFGSSYYNLRDEVDDIRYFLLRKGISNHRIKTDTNNIPLYGSNKVIFYLGFGANEPGYRYRYPDNYFIPGASLCLIYESYGARPISETIEELNPSFQVYHGSAPWTGQCFPETDLFFTSRQTITEDYARRGINSSGSRMEGWMDSIPDPITFLNSYMFEKREIGESAFTALEKLGVSMRNMDPKFICPDVVQDVD